MKCTNRLLAILLLCTCLTFTGCGAKQFALAYDKDSTISSFRLTVDQELKPKTFSADLCVTSTDITEGKEADLSEASSAGLFNLNKKEVIYAKNIHEKLYPASLTKLMTALVALKYGKLEDTIVASSNVQITESGAQLCGLKEGDKLTLDQALHALLMYSANDAAVAIAESIGGTVENFAKMMTEEANKIGATNTHFLNPHGLQEEGHYTTSYDLYLIFNEVMKYERFNEIIQMTSYETVYTDRSGNSKNLSIETTNLYLKGSQVAPENITVIGGKTGTTSKAGSCLILLAKDAAGNPYISVILNSKDRGVLYTQMTNLLDEINK